MLLNSVFQSIDQKKKLLGTSPLCVTKYGTFFLFVAKTLAIPLIVTHKVSEKFHLLFCFVLVCLFKSVERRMRSYLASLVMVLCVSCLQGNPRKAYY